MDSRIKIHCECGKSGLVERKHIGKTITCPKCGIARIKVEDPEANQTTDANAAATGFTRKPPANQRNQIPPVPPIAQDEVNPQGWWTDWKIPIGAFGIAVLITVLVAVVFLAIVRDSPDDPPAIANGDLALPQGGKGEEKLLPEISEQVEPVEPKEVTPAVDVAENQPAVVLPQSPAEIASLAV